MTEREIDQKLAHDTEELQRTLGNQFQCQALQRIYQADLERYVELPPKSPERAPLLATLNALRAQLRSLQCGVPVLS